METASKGRNRPSTASACTALLGLLMIACSDPTADLVITEKRVAARADSKVTGVVPSAERFTPPGMLRKAGAHGQAAQAGDPRPAPFVWTTPADWKEVPPRSSLRIADFSMESNSQWECYIVAMRGDGGGLLANINRWRDQVGAENISEEELADLPTHKLFRQPAPLLEVTGDYSNMGAPTVEGAKLMGLIHSFPEFTLFVKMTGPEASVNEQREAFLEFCATLDIDATMGEAPNTGHDHGPPQGNWNVPASWSQTAPKTMRVVNFALEGGGECYVSVLGGGGGGLLPNVNRWLGQIGRDPIDEDGLQDLPRLQMLGREGVLVEGSGDFEGMGAEAASDQGLMAVMLELPDRTVFVKMVGPAEVVSSQREAFVTFAESLTEEDV